MAICHITGAKCDCTAPQLCHPQFAGKEVSIPDFLRDLAQRLMHVPVTYGTNQSDVDRLLRIAGAFEKAERIFSATDED